MSVNEKMTALADEVRELGGITDKLVIDEMTVKIGDANTEIDEQASLLVQAVAALNGKAAGSSGTGIELCTVTITMGDIPLAGDEVFYYIDGSSEIKSLFGSSLLAENSTNINVMKNSFICTNVLFGNREPDIIFDYTPVRLYFITENAILNISM